MLTLHRETWREEFEKYNRRKSLTKKDFYISNVSVDKGSHGANMLNTIPEALVSPIEALTGGESTMSILSNLAYKLNCDS